MTFDMNTDLTQMKCKAEDPIDYASPIKRVKSRRISSPSENLSTPQPKANSFPEEPAVIEE